MLLTSEDRVGYGHPMGPAAGDKVRAETQDAGVREQ